jgi:hypothetical protein
LSDLLGKLLLSNLNGKGEGQQMRFLKPHLYLTRLDKQRNTSKCTRHRPILTQMEETFGKDGQIRQKHNKYLLLFDVPYS